MNDWKKNYTKQFTVAMVVYAIVVVLSTTMLGLGWVKTGVGQVGLALLPAFPFAYILWLIVKNVGQLDELERQIHLEAVLIATFVTGFVSFAYGLLEVSEVVWKMPAFIWAPMMIIVWGVANRLIRRRYFGGNSDEK